MLQNAVTAETGLGVKLKKIHRFTRNLLYLHYQLIKSMIMKKRFETADGLPQYFKTLDQVAKPISKEEELRLADRIQAGDERALNSLVTANLKFAVTMANKFIGMGLPIEDLIQEANAGLIDAARKFTSDKDVKFITYAQFHVRKRLNLSLCETGRTVRLPVNQEYDIYKRKMAGEEINLHNVDIDQPVGESESNTLGDLLLKSLDQDPFDTDERSVLLSKALNTLKSSELEIIRLFYGFEEDELSMKEIAERTGRELSEVGRALKTARHKMRKFVGA
jgi:RNA polymerase primary sigma factor